MDLGCLDLGCISVLEKQNNETVFDAEKKAGDAEESVVGTTKIRKSKESTLNAVNKSTSQIKKPHRKNSSPLNWFPRKKMDSYLMRKIKLLQEIGGMNSTLDETLGDSSPHYTRVLREKIAARKAACKAMEARKAAMVEASWCRILRAARIQNEEAESLLLKAEQSVAEAFEAAASMGVIMYDRPDCPRKPCEIESSSVNIGGSTTHTVTASFESAFDVDKEVASAVKTAFIQLANCPSSSNKDEFKDLLRRISENPDMCETNQELPECSLECESDDTLVERESGSRSDSTKLVDMMLERLKRLQEDELASLATIVATCGLNAALLEIENSKQCDPESFTDDAFGHAVTRRLSNIEYFKDGHMRRKQVVTELPSLDKFLVKHMSRLEREVQEAKNSTKNQSKEGSEDNPEGSKSKGDNSNNDSCVSEAVPDLGSVLVKHTSRLEREIEEAKRKSGKAFEKDCKKSGNMRNAPDLPNLDKFLVKHVSRLEREVQEAKNTGKSERNKGSVDSVTLSEAVPDLGSILVKNSSKLEKEIDAAKKTSGKAFENAHKRKDVPEVLSLDKFLVKHVSRFEREVQEAKNTRKNDTSANMISSQEISSCMDGKQMGKENVNSNKQAEGVLDGTVKEKLDTTANKNMSRIERAKLETLEAFSLQDGNNLDRILVKPIHRLEKEKMQALVLDSGYDSKKKGGRGTDASDCESLDKVLVKHISRLEKEKMQALVLDSGYDSKKKGGRGTDASDCKSLDKVLVKHISRLEKEKMGLGSKEEELKVKRGSQQFQNNSDSLDESRLEKEEKSGVVGQQSGDHHQIKHSDVRREERERELQEAWGGLSLGNTVQPRLSRLERDKAAWIKAEEEERRRARMEM